jgi:hypothetical protein
MPSRLTMPHGRRIALNLPAGSGLEEIEQARAELARLNRERRETDERRRTLLQAREEAAQTDLAAAARAIRGGAKAPKTRQVDTVDAELAKLEEYAAAVDTALDQCESELVDAVEEKREQRTRELGERLSDEQERWVELVDACMEQLAKINTTASLAAWYGGFPGPYPAFRERSTGHLSMRGTGGSVYAPAAVLAELRAAFAERAAHGGPPVMPVPEGGPTPLTKVPSVHAA